MLLLRGSVSRSGYNTFAGQPLFDFKLGHPLADSACSRLSERERSCRVCVCTLQNRVRRENNSGEVVFDMDLDIAKRLDHQHDFHLTAAGNEMRTLWVVVLTAVTMLVEITAGFLTGSMALLADGWHMGTHALALGISYIAYVLARTFAGTSKYAFGTGKFGVLAGYTSALWLGAVAVLMIVESVGRFGRPVNIAFDEAIMVAVAGLVVNVASMRILHSKSVDHTDHPHDHDHEHTHDDDHNLMAAYLHVVADALTSLLAILALVTGKLLGWSFLDPVMGVLGGILIARWAWGLLRNTGLILLDGTADDGIRDAVTAAIESDGDSRVRDLHVWPVSSNALAAAITVVTSQELTAVDYGIRLVHIHRLRHSTIEVHHYEQSACRA